MEEVKDLRDSSSQAVRPLFQIIFIVITSLAILLIIYKRTSRVTIDSFPTEVKDVTAKDLKKFGGFPNKVTTGLYISQFQKFDVGNNVFLFNGSVWFLMDQGIVSVNTLNNFEFTRGEILYKSAPRVRMVGDKLLVEYSVRVQFSTPLSYKSFPVSDHQLRIILIHQMLSPGDVVFSSGEKDFTISSDIKEEGWKEVSRSSKAGYIVKKLGEYDDREQYYSAVSYAIDYSREDIRSIIAIMLPLLFMFFLSLFSLSTSQATAISMSNGVMAGTLAFRFVIDTMAPKVGYFMLSDYIFFLFLFLNFVTFLCVLIDSYSSVLGARNKMIFVLCSHAALILGCIYLFLIKD